MDERTSWTATTHDWSSDLDMAHLAEVQADQQRWSVGGVRHMILEVLAYANEEAEHLGRVGSAQVIVNSEGLVTITDDGRGTDIRLDRDGHLVRKPVMATQDVRFFGADNAPRLPDGLPRQGMSTVAALVPHLRHDNHRADGAWSQTYRYGIPDCELHLIAGDGATGTTVAFLSGADILGPRNLTASDVESFEWLRIDARPHYPHTV